MKTIIFSLFILFYAIRAQAQLDFSPTIRNGTIVKHEYYSLSYVEEHEQAEWVFYKLKKEDLEKKVKRVNSYRP